MPNPGEHSDQDPSLSRKGQNAPSSLEEFIASGSKPIDPNRGVTAKEQILLVAARDTSRGETLPPEKKSAPEERKVAPKTAADESFWSFGGDLPARTSSRDMDGWGFRW